MICIVEYDGRFTVEIRKLKEHSPLFAIQYFYTEMELNNFISVLPENCKIIYNF